jgi:uncharacterized protein YutE (UPF0331/DUF86 family)
MKLNGVIQRKFSLLDNHVLELEQRPKAVDLATFRGDWALRMMTERALQIMAEIVIEVAERIISLRGAGPAATALEAIDKLVQLGVLKSAEPYLPVVGFRNLVVHQYEEIDPAIVYAIATAKLDVLRQFRDEVDRYEV